MTRAIRSKPVLCVFFGFTMGFLFGLLGVREGLLPLCAQSMRTTRITIDGLSLGMRRDAVVISHRRLQARINKLNMGDTLEVGQWQRWGWEGSPLTLIFRRAVGRKDFVLEAIYGASKVMTSGGIAILWPGRPFKMYKAIASASLGTPREISRVGVWPMQIRMLLFETGDANLTVNVDSDGLVGRVALSMRRRR